MKRLKHAMMALAMGLCSIAGASSIVFTTAGDWNEPSNWDLGVLPIAGDDVYINANVSLTNSTPVFNSYTLNAGKTHTFNGWDTLLSANTVTLNGTMTHAQNTAANTNSLGVWVPNARVNIACADMIMNIGSKIDVTSKGYLGGTTTYTKGNGPGGGGATNVSGGGGHGGIGGAYSDTYTMKGKPYGNPAYPTEPGSGGGMGQQTSTPCHGGGAVKIAATGTVTVNGEILASTPASTSNYTSGGSGGSILISCSTIGGSGGKLIANGGNGGGLGGSGGGGRIAILYDPAAQSALPLPSLTIQTLPGRTGNLSDLGSLHMSDNQFFTRNTTGVFSNYAGELTTAAAGFNTIVKDSIEFNNCWLRFPVEGFTLEATNSIKVLGSTPLLSKLEISNATVNCAGSILVDNSTLALYRNETDSPSLSGASMTVDNKGIFRIYSGKSATPYGAKVTISGDLLVSGGAWIYPHSHPTNGASVLFNVNNMRLQATSGINSVGLGFGPGPVKNTNGYGPGGGIGNNVSGGGGYGGVGGAANTPSQAGKAYGDYLAPTQPGSGGGSGQPDVVGSKGGGGLVRVIAQGEIEINGSIIADGGAAAGNYNSGGSGGAVYLTCATLRGVNGIVSAKGGNGGSTLSGAGGGGRISINYDPVQQAALPAPTIQFNTAPGVVGNVVPGMGDIGSLYMTDSTLLLRAGSSINHSGVWLAPLANPLMADKLAATNSWLRFQVNDLEIDIANDVLVAGTDARLHRLEFSNAVVRCANFNVSSNAVLALSAGATNGTAKTFGAVIEAANNFTLGPATQFIVASHPLDGAITKIRSRNMSVNKTAIINADGLGYLGGVSSGNGQGPGGGKYFNDGSGGGGYGGAGGRSGSGFGLAYGSAKAPLHPGSGGGSGLWGVLGQPGGGAILLQVLDDAVVDGTISANGTKAPGSRSGAGSGGGILITCRKFSGASSAILRANGGDGATGASNGMGGGGGRIAVCYGVEPGTDHDAILATDLRRAIATPIPSTFLGTNYVTAGIGSVSFTPQAAVGTITYMKMAPGTTMLIIR